MAITSRTKGILTLIGGVLIHIANGSIYSYGVLNPYMISYLYIYNKDIKIDDGFFFLSLGIFAQSLFVVLGGFLERKLGPRM